MLDPADQSNAAGVMAMSIARTRMLMSDSRRALRRDIYSVRGPHPPTTCRNVDGDALTGVLYMHIIGIAGRVVVLHDHVVTGRDLVHITLDLIGDRDRIVSGLNANPHGSNVLIWTWSSRPFNPYSNARSCRDPAVDRDTGHQPDRYAAVAALAQSKAAMAQVAGCTKSPY